jgi:hypothetical protein
VVENLLMVGGVRGETKQKRLSYKLRAKPYRLAFQVAHDSRSGLLVPFSPSLTSQ